MNKTYEPKSFEDRIYADWEKKKYFAAKPNKNKKPFTIVIPPPNVTGQLHVGHALDDTIQDAIIRYKRMRGFETLWLPGTDHAALATEVKVMETLREEGLTKEGLGREEFLKRVYAWKDKYGGRIVKQFKKMGFSCDWDRLAFTMDEKCSRAVREVFVNLYNKGLIYRGNRITNWCPCCKTAISDVEVEYEQAASHLWHIKYKIDGEDGYITVATTRPETMLGDTAVAVNPKDKRYASVIGKNLVLPLTGRKIPVIADEYVESDFGTGAVKITPAHDPNDFEVGQRHGLETICVMNNDGTMAENAGAYAGLDRFEARKRMVADLEKEGLLVKIENHDNNVGHCSRCHAVIEPMVSRQWYVKMKPLAEPAIKVVNDKSIEFLPERFKKIYLHWMENIRDWCISRQLWWGHRIPAFYCDGCGEMTVSKEDISACPHCGGKVRQDDDVLDTWFSSALWPFSTLGYPDKTADLDYFYPTDVLVTAYDIIFFWVARMIFSGLEHTGKIPFHKVLIHGIVRDSQGRKMSKSLGNGVDPLEIIETHGADALRMSLVCGISAGGDIRFSSEKLEGYRNFMNKLWNAARFTVLNLENADVLALEKVKLTLADKWILTKLDDVIKTCVKYMDKYEVGLCASALYDFTWSDFCDWYIELSKTRLYSTDRGVRSDAVSVLVHVLRNILQLLHPIVPFVTEEIYQNLPQNATESIMVSEYPSGAPRYAAAKKQMDAVMEMITRIRTLRADMKVPSNKRTALYIVPAEGNEKLLKAGAGYMEKLAGGNSVTFGKPSGKCATVATPWAEIYIPMDELVNPAAELERLNKELETCESELARALGKLNNAGFTAKAPAKLIDEEKAKAEKYAELKKKILSAIDEMKNV
ncbi:valine--tRNA ligase [Pumilibacter intestinalis]|uniref:valine--tRNA ligase n=1 Tax=Pumilibacter intestinalis TaxID=2941511 RepID=UPI002040D2CB|nr:valine--tRNA ligase [Pumilibacter intestinalis]